MRIVLLIGFFCRSRRVGRRRQTVTVEVMPLVGGHLQLPKVRLSRYIPAVSSESASASASVVAAGGQGTVALTDCLSFYFYDAVNLRFN